MVEIGEPAYNTEQRREILRQLKQHLDREWLKRKREGTLSKKKIPLPNAELAEPKKRKRKRKRQQQQQQRRKRRIKLFKVYEGVFDGDNFILKHVKTIRRKNRKYKK